MAILTSTEISHFIPENCFLHANIVFLHTNVVHTYVCIYGIVFTCKCTYVCMYDIFLHLNVVRTCVCTYAIVL